MRLFLRILAGIIVVLLLGFIGGFVYLRSSLPQTSGTIELKGLDGHVQIIRDEYGVPHIFAATDHDAFFAQGYIHAQDRMWQMEFQRRVGAGRLSEILGDVTIETDQFLRTLGVYRAVKTSWPTLNDKSQMALEAYAAGVNAWLNEGRVLPPEFIMLGVEPEPWTVYDSLVWAKMMAWDLNGNFARELLRVRLTQAIGPERTTELMPPYPDDGITILSADSISNETANTLLNLDTFIQKNLQLRGLDVGSNNWVVDGSRTDSGMPILADDPHLGARIPSIWYLNELQGHQLHVTGASLPGLPSIIIGHNEHIAWGVTNLGPDVQDLYMERINPENLNQYEVDGKWVDMEIEEELIYVKDEADPIVWAARRTRHGPLISDVSQDAFMPLSLRWVSLDEQDPTMDGFLGINYATNWEEFTEALQYYVAPSQNFVYADVEGNIGYFGPGNIPIRAKGEGMVPVPGWDSEYEWVGWIPFEELPQSYNPEIGYIATANNRVVPDEYPYFITNEWVTPHRAKRIVELIEEKSSGGEKISVEDMIAIQADQYSNQAEELLPFLLNIEPTDDRQAEALDYLRNWDGNTPVDSVATTIYQAWFMYVGQLIFEDDLTKDLYNRFAERHHPVFLLSVLSETDSVWCDNVLTAGAENCSDIAQEALKLALDDLDERMGSNMANWQWGEVHRTQYPHNPFSEVDALKRFFHREIANGGDGYTVNVAPPRFDQDFQQMHVPSYREIITLDNWDNSLYIHTTGQSGNPFSAHYDDLIIKHQAVEYLTMTFGLDNVTGEILILQPE